MLETLIKIMADQKSDGMQKVVCRASAKVPIVKCWDPELQLACDLNVNNTLALENTRMIKTYIQLDDRVRPLAKIIKYWTKRRILNDAGKSNTKAANPGLALMRSCSFRWHDQLLYLDMHDHQLLAAKRSSYTAFTSEDGGQAVTQRQVRELRVCGRR